MTATTDVEMTKAQGGSPQDKTAAASSPDKVGPSSSPAKAVGEAAGYVLTFLILAFTEINRRGSGYWLT